MFAFLLLLEPMFDFHSKPLLLFVQKKHSNLHAESVKTEEFKVPDVVKQEAFTKAA